jgi:hypothetical protein
MAIAIGVASNLIWRVIERIARAIAPFFRDWFTERPPQKRRRP